MNKYDTIIVGQGLAGSLLAFYWVQKGKKVLVIDEDPLISSSKLAAGKFNPIVFKRLNKSWLLSNLLPEVFSFYPKIESAIKLKIFHQKDNMVKLFANDQQKIDWENRKIESDFDQYLGDVSNLSLPQWIEEVTSGHSRVLQSGWVDISGLIKGVREYIINAGSSVENRTFDFSKLTEKNGEVRYDDQYTADQIIFAEGYKVRENPFFGYLPFSLTKGEVLTIEAPEMQLENIVSKGFFIKPLGNHQYKIGATFNWEDKTEIPTEEAKQQLVEKLEKLYHGPYKIIDQQAGIRPTVIDRRPIIGAHPKHKNYYIFNGLGTKGVMIAPYFVQEFYKYIYNNESLNPEVDIERFTQKHYPNID